MQPYSYTNKKGITYFLNSKVVNLRSKKTVNIYYFSKDVRPETSITELPSSLTIVENPRTGLPVVKKAFR